MNEAPPEGFRSALMLMLDADAVLLDHGSNLKENLKTNLLTSIAASQHRSSGCSTTAVAIGEPPPANLLDSPDRVVS